MAIQTRDLKAGTIVRIGDRTGSISEVGIIVKTPEEGYTGSVLSVGSGWTMSAREAAHDYKYALGEDGSKFLADYIEDHGRIEAWWVSSSNIGEILDEVPATAPPVVKALADFLKADDRPAADYRQELEDFKALVAAKVLEGAKDHGWEYLEDGWLKALGLERPKKEKPLRRITIALDLEVEAEGVSDELLETDVATLIAYRVKDWADDHERVDIGHDQYVYVAKAYEIKPVVKVQRG